MVITGGDGGRVGKNWLQDTNLPLDQRNKFKNSVL
jgi:hypothetical protein